MTKKIRASNPLSTKEWSDIKQYNFPSIHSRSLLLAAIVRASEGRKLFRHSVMENAIYCPQTITSCLASCSYFFTAAAQRLKNCPLRMGRRASENNEREKKKVFLRCCPCRSCSRSRSLFAFCTLIICLCLSS
jgi:hypothetical protein